VKSKKRVILILILITTSLTLGWQGYLRWESASLAEAVAEELPSPDARLPAPDFSLLDLEGNVVHISDYRGSVVLAGFWTTW
jgi:hypothetical protein